MDQKKIGQFLRSLRNEKQMTQEQLAEHFNVSSRSVSRWETGSNLPDISLLVEIADFYEVDVREIIDGERKSEMMDKEVREVAEHMADYAGKEKSRLLTFIQVAGIVGMIVLVAAIVIQSIGMEPNAKSISVLIASMVGLVIMGVITLYVTGVLQKIATNKKSFFTTIKIVAMLLMGYVAIKFVLMMIAVGLLILSVVIEKIEVYNDVENYDRYFNTDVNDKGKYSKFYIVNNYDMFDVFPETVVQDMDVKEFQYVYYNPWDPQFVTYMTVEYTPDDYAEEMARLGDLGTDEYTEYYSVTGEPEGFDIIAMKSDDYHGFVYAMIPENAGTDNTEITYVGIWFCNYFLDLDIHEYLPDEYLLQGFDATNDNPYQEEQLAEKR